MVGGEIAVKTFFIISGFYMSLILNEKYIGGNKSYKLFISNRFLKLFPIYWVILALTLVLCIIVGVADGNYPVIGQYLSINNSLASLTYTVFSNLFIFGQDALLFTGIHAQNGSLYFTSNFALHSPQLFRFLFVPQAWTLGLELMFYLIAPLILDKSLKTIILLILLSFGIRLYIHYYLGLQHDPWTYRFFPSELMFFLFGNLSYRLYIYFKGIKIQEWLYIPVFFYLIAFTMAYGLIPTWRFPEELKELLYYASALVVIPLIFIQFKSNKMDTRIGELSYPVYICHIFIIMLVTYSKAPITINGVVISIMAIGLSLLLNRLIANPIEKYRQSRVVKNSTTS
jgi:peptidoglycan/LPS O-acetylase OafA/YrhL